MRVEGHLKLIGNGKTDQYGWYVRSVIGVGDRELRAVRCSPYMDSFMHPGDHIALGIQRVLWLKTVYAIATDDGRVRRGGPFGLLFLLALLAGAAFGVVTFATGTWTVAALAFIAFLAVGPIKALFLLASFAPLGAATEDRKTA